MKQLVEDDCKRLEEMEYHFLHNVDYDKAFSDSKVLEQLKDAIGYNTHREHVGHTQFSTE
jgi:hypothetical protein